MISALGHEKCRAEVRTESVQSKQGQNQDVSQDQVEVLRREA